MILEASRPSAPGSGRGFEGECPSVTPCILTLNKAAWISERPPLCSAAGPGGTRVTKEGLSVFMVGCCGAGASRRGGSFCFGCKESSRVCRSTLETEGPTEATVLAWTEGEVSPGLP